MPKKGGVLWVTKAVIKKKKRWMTCQIRLHQEKWMFFYYLLTVIKPCWLINLNFFRLEVLPSHLTSCPWNMPVAHSTQGLSKRDIAQHLFFSQMNKHFQNSIQMLLVFWIVTLLSYSYLHKRLLILFTGSDSLTFFLLSGVVVTKVYMHVSRAQVILNY